MCKKNPEILTPSKNIHDENGYRNDGRRKGMNETEIGKNEKKINFSGRKGKNASGE